MANVSISSQTSYAAISDLALRTDLRAIADTLLDAGARAGGTQPTLATITSDPNAVACMQAALNWASGQVEMACFVGNKYVATDLQALTGMSLAVLVGLVCDLATWRLMQRRYPNLQITEQYRAANEMLQALRDGARIFSLSSQAAAGLPQNQFITQQTINMVDLSTTQARRFYGRRSKERIGRGTSN